MKQKNTKAVAEKRIIGFEEAKKLAETGRKKRIAGIALIIGSILLSLILIIWIDEDFVPILLLVIETAFFVGIFLAASNKGFIIGDPKDYEDIQFEAIPCRDHAAFGRNGFVIYSISKKSKLKKAFFLPYKSMKWFYKSTKSIYGIPYFFGGTFVFINNEKLKRKEIKASDETIMCVASVLKKVNPETLLGYTKENGVAYSQFRKAFKAQVKAAKK